MTAYDPFAPAQTEAPAPAAGPVATAEAAPAADAKSEVVVTLKAGTGYDAPWVVFHAPDAAAAMAQLSDPNVTALLDRAKLAGSYFSGGNAAPAASAAAPVQAAPAGAQAPPPGAPECPPGFTYKSGVTKAGKPYQGYFPPQGSDAKPVWIN